MSNIYIWKSRNAVIIYVGIVNDILKTRNIILNLYNSLFFLVVHYSGAAGLSMSYSIVYHSFDQA